MCKLDALSTAATEYDVIFSSASGVDLVLINFHVLEFDFVLCSHKKFAEMNREPVV
jgi:hypothetical protein